jgi:8-oxo-dGTP diphosphatase
MISDVICTVDVVLMTLFQGELSVALFKRDKAPFQGAYALPGGYVHTNEDKTAVDSALRTLVAKTGLATPYLEQLATFTGADRDPRGWSVSVVYFALVPVGILEASTQGDMKLFSVSNLPADMPFDHEEIVTTAVERVRSKSIYSSLPANLLGKRFTIPQLQAVYEQILGEKLDKVTFRKKMSQLDILQIVDGAFEGGKGSDIYRRPAQLYRLKPKFKRILSTVSRAFKS